MKYSKKELAFCIGLRCIFNNVKGLIHDKSNKPPILIDAIILSLHKHQINTGSVNVSLVTEEQQNGYSSLRVIEIPEYEKVKKKRLTKLVFS